MKEPNFFIVGAAKAGTTSLYHYLEQHPEIYMSPIKEPHYFSKDMRCENFSFELRPNCCSLDMKKYLLKSELEKRHIAYIENKSDYLQLFRDVDDEKAIGEISSGYLYSHTAANEIYNFNPNAKIVILLRNPSERAFSHWSMAMRIYYDRMYGKTFYEAVEEDQHTIEKKWGKAHLYIELGMYYEQVKRYLDLFPKEQVLILLNEDLKSNSEQLLNKLFAFLEVEPISIDTKKRHNAAELPRHIIVSKMVRDFQIGRFLPKKLKSKIRKFIYTRENLPTLTFEDREYLSRYFNDDIKKLEKLIDRDLSGWLV